MFKSALRTLVLIVSFSPAMLAVAAPTPTPPGFGSDIIPVAMGCGIGSVRDERGVCRRRFNLFRHHDDFRAYKQRHCKPVNTPNGRVGFCRI